MLQLLQKNKKVYSIVFLVVSALLFTPVFFLVSNTIVRVLLGVMLLVHLVLAIIYYGKGIAIAAKCMVYYLLFVVGVTLSVLLPQYIKLPPFLDNEMFSSISRMIVIAFIVVIPLPNMVQKWMVAQLEGTEKAATMEEIMEKSFGIQKREISSVDYDVFTKYKSGMKYAAAPYSLVNASSAVSILRIAIGVGCFVLGVIGIVVGPNIIDGAQTFLHSQAFWITLASVLLFVIGAVIVIFGFLRAVICLLGMGILLVVSYSIFDFLKEVWSVSVVLFAFLTIGILMLAGVSLWIVFRFVFNNQKRTFTSYVEDDCVFLVDAYLEDAAPVLKYSECLKATIHFDENVKWKNFDQFNDALLTYSATQKLIYAGAILNEEQQSYTIYIYFRSTKQKQKIRSFLAKKITYPIEIEVINDFEWQTYKTVLLPKDETLLRLYNQTLMEELEQSEFDFSEKVPVVFTSVFQKKEDAEQFKMDLEESEYEKIVYEDESEYAAENGWIQKDSHRVYLQKTMKLSQAWLDIETLKLLQLAKQAGGEYQFLYLGELESSIPNEEEQQ